MRAYFRPGLYPKNFGGGCNFELGRRRLDAENGLNKPFENVSCLRRNQKFFLRKGQTNFDIISSVVFSGKINLKQVEEQKKALEDPGACSPGKFLKVHVLQWPF